MNIYLFIYLFFFFFLLSQDVYGMLHDANCPLFFLFFFSSFSLKGSSMSYTRRRSYGRARYPTICRPPFSKKKDTRVSSANTRTFLSPVILISSMMMMIHRPIFHFSPLSILVLRPYYRHPFFFFLSFFSRSFDRQYNP